MEHRVKLTPRQVEVVRAVAEANGVKAGADLMGLNPKTFGSHLRMAKARYNAKSWEELVAAAIQDGYVPDRRKGPRDVG